VVGEIGGGGVHPQRPAQPSRRYVEELPEQGHHVQPGCDHLPDSLDPEATAPFEQAAAVEDGQGTDVPVARSHPARA
jgi:hypothetical protein